MMLMYVIDYVFMFIEIYNVGLLNVEVLVCFLYVVKFDKVLCLFLINDD